jgi:hypothetical protein
MNSGKFRGNDEHHGSPSDLPYAVPLNDAFSSFADDSLPRTTLSITLSICWMFCRILFSLYFFSLFVLSRLTFSLVVELFYPNMSEESKSAEGDYVMMGGGSVVPGRGAGLTAGLDDANISQEERDHRLAIAMQQQENAAAYDEHQKKHQEILQAKNNRTGRSGTFTKLAAVRDHDHGMLQVPAEYTSDNAYVKSNGDYMGSGPNYVPPNKDASPQEIADFKMAAEIQKVEQVGAGTVRQMQKIVQEETEEEEANAQRTARSNYHINQKKH